MLFPFAHQLHAQVVEKLLSGRGRQDPVRTAARKLWQGVQAAEAAASEGDYRFVSCPQQHMRVKVLKAVACRPNDTCAPPLTPAHTHARCAAFRSAFATAGPSAIDSNQSDSKACSTASVPRWVPP